MKRMIRASVTGDTLEYEIKTTIPDPFDAMAGIDVPNMIDTWEEASIEDLKILHRHMLAEDMSIPDIQKEDYEERYGEPWKDTPIDFEDFLKEEIEAGNIRIVE